MGVGMLGGKGQQSQSSNDDDNQVTFGSQETFELVKNGIKLNIGKILQEGDNTNVKDYKAKYTDVTLKTCGVRVIPDEEASTCIKGQDDFATEEKKRHDVCNKGVEKENKIIKDTDPITQIFEWEGDRGKSALRLRTELLEHLDSPPKLPAKREERIRKLMRLMAPDENGEYRIEYTNYIPDLTPCALITLECDYSDVKGTPAEKNGNSIRDSVQSKADKTFAEYLNTYPDEARRYGFGEFVDHNIPISGTDVGTWRDECELTWHECSDLQMIQLVPFEVNSRFKHCGGCAESQDGGFQKFAANYTYNFNFD